MEASRPNPALSAARAEELQRENERMREQLRAYAAQHTNIRNALQEVAGEREATERLAHQVSVEERATRTAVQVQGNSIWFAVILQIINFFILLILIFGMFLYLPREVERRMTPTSTVVTPGTPNSTIVVPTR